MKGINVAKELATRTLDVDILSTMQLDAGDFSEQLVPVHRATHSHKPEGRNLNSSRPMNLKFALGMSESKSIILQRKVDYWLLVQLHSAAVISACPYVQGLI